MAQALTEPDGRANSVRATCRLPDGRLSVSTYELGVLTQAADSPTAPLRRWPAARLPTARPPLLMSFLPAAIGPGRAWLAAGDDFQLFDPHGGALRPLPTLGPDGARVARVNARMLRRAPATGQVWGSAEPGLYFLDSAAGVFRTYAPRPGAAPLAGVTIEDFWPDGRGQLWLATPQGVERLTIATGARLAYGPTAPPPRRAPFDGARCLLPDPATGRLWVGTRTHGLLCVEPDGHGRTVLAVGQGLPDGSVASLLRTPDGALWLGTYRGLVRYQPATGHLAVLTTANGLPHDELNAYAATVDPTTQSLLVGGVAGMARVWPGRIRRGATAPRLLLTAV